MTRECESGEWQKDYNYRRQRERTQCAAHAIVCAPCLHVPRWLVPMSLPCPYKSRRPPYHSFHSSFIVVFFCCFFLLCPRPPLLLLVHCAFQSICHRRIRSYFASDNTDTLFALDPTDTRFPPPILVPLHIHHGHESLHRSSPYSGKGG